MRPKNKDELTSSKIISALQAHDSEGTVARIAFWVDPSAYEKQDDRRWKQWKEHIRITLHCMMHDGVVEREKRGPWKGDLWLLTGDGQ